MNTHTHTHVLHLLVLTLKTQLSLQELTGPAGEEARAATFWKLENRWMNGN